MSLSGCGLQQSQTLPVSHCALPKLNARVSHHSGETSLAPALIFILFSKGGGSYEIAVNAFPHITSPVPFSASAVGFHSPHLRAIGEGH